MKSPFKKEQQATIKIDDPAQVDIEDAIAAAGPVTLGVPGLAGAFAAAGPVLGVPGLAGAFDETLQPAPGNVEEAVEEQAPTEKNPPAVFNAANKPAR